MTAAVDEKTAAPTKAVEDATIMVPIEEPDPLWDFNTFGRRMSKGDRDLFYQGADYENTDVQACGHREDMGEAENFKGSRGRWTCTRPPHPDHWRHIATGGYRGDIEAVAAWGGVDPAQLAVEPLIADPDPGDFELVEGKLYKFRNRKTVLLMLGKRRGKRVEVLDLTHQRYRVLAEEQLVPRPADAEPVTQAEMEWVAKFMAERRNKTREVAIGQRSEGRFKNKDELDKILTELHLEPTVQVTKGYVSMNIHVSGQDRASMKKAIVDWAKNLPPIEGVRLVKAINEGDMGFNLNVTEG